MAIVETEAVNLMESDICSGLIEREGGHRRIIALTSTLCMPTTCVVFAQQSVASNLRGITTPAAPDALKINSENVRLSIDVLLLCDFYVHLYIFLPLLVVFVQCVHLKFKDFYFLSSTVAVCNITLI